MKYYAIADLHGRYDLLEKAFKMIEEHADVSKFKFSPTYKIITLGDYIDRGPQSKEIIDALMRRVGHDTHGNELICLQGNHEAMAVETMQFNLNIDWWMGNGGDTTLQSYGFGQSYYNFPSEHFLWMKNLPLYYETPKQVFVHAGIPQWGMSLPPKNDHRIYDMQWMLYDKREAGGWKGKHVVHGHHQFEDGPHVWKSAKGGRTDLDTYAWKTGRLVVGVFDDTQLDPIDFIEVTHASS